MVEIMIVILIKNGTYSEFSRSFSLSLFFNFRSSMNDDLSGFFSNMEKSARQRSLSDGDGNDGSDSQPDLLNNTPPIPPKRAHRSRNR